MPVVRENIQAKGLVPTPALTPSASLAGAVSATAGSVRPRARFVRASCGLGELCSDGKNSVGGEEGRVVWFRDTVRSADSLG